MKKSKLKGKLQSLKWDVESNDEEIKKLRRKLKQQEIYFAVLRILATILFIYGLYHLIK